MSTITPNTPAAAHLWNVKLQVPLQQKEKYIYVLECLCDSVSWEEDAKENLLEIQGIYVDRTPTPETLETIRQKIDMLCTHCSLPTTQLNIEEIESKNWLIENRDSFPPQHIGKFFIYGSHYEKVLPQHLIPLHIDAALAFGSGEHETTKGCLTALSELDISKNKNAAFLDMGCGSGILSIALAKLCNGHITAIDVDPFSVNTTLENIGINQVANIVSVILGDGYAVLSPNEKFQGIVSNILAGPLCAMASDLKKHLLPNGWVILSGLLASQAPDVIAAHAQEGISLIKEIKINEWSTLVCRNDI